MKKGQISYTIQGNKTNRELTLEAKELLNESPDISKIPGIRVNRNTIIYPKSKERYDALLKQSK